MRRPLIRTVGPLLVGLIAATLVTELLFRLTMATPLRWVLPLPQAPFWGPDPATGYRHRANVVGMWVAENRTFIRTSNLGLRDRDRELARGDGPRAIIVGNSFVEALQVDWPETSAAVAEHILARKRPDAEVVNLGLAAATPAIEVARLQSQGLAMAPDLAIVVLQANYIAHPAATDDSQFSAYRLGADGIWRLSYGFRDSYSFRFRSSVAGDFFYWLSDHSQVVRVLHNRLNSRHFGPFGGWVRAFSVWPNPAMEAHNPAPTCASGELDAHVALWVDGVPAEGRAVLDAFIRDLGAIRRDRRLPIVVATSAIEARCPSLAIKRAHLTDAIRAKLEAAGLEFVDLDARVVAKVGADKVVQLFGFDAAIGDGHLNVEGNRIHGEIFAEIIDEVLSRRVALTVK